LEGDGPEADYERNGAFKLIPSVVEGSWIIRQSVGNTPVILGRKLKTYYYK
jgi:Protein ENHANCED DISEASE RESISTANCE 2, C-terminal